MVVDESDDGAGDQPSALHARQQKGVGVDELFSGREFLNQRGDGRPEHPEAGRHQRVHQVEFPHLHAAREGEDRNGEQ